MNCGEEFWLFQKEMLHDTNAEFDRESRQGGVLDRVLVIESSTINHFWLPGENNQ